MVTATHSKRSSCNVNLVPQLSTSSKDKPSEEEPKAFQKVFESVFDNVKVTQDSTSFTQVDTEEPNEQGIGFNDTIDKDYYKTANNQHKLLNEQGTGFNDTIDEDYYKTVNNQHKLLNPRMTKAEHVTKQAEVREAEQVPTELTVQPAQKIATVVLPPPAQPTPVQKPTTAQVTTNIQPADQKNKLLKTNLDA